MAGWRAGWLAEARDTTGHMGAARDVANAAVFPAGAESAYVTGIELRVDSRISVRI